LTAELAVTSGAPRQVLGRAFPFLRTVQEDYRDAIGPLRVPAGPSNAGTIGTAFDLRVHLQARIRPYLQLAMVGAEQIGPHVMAAYEQVLDRLGPHEQTWNQPVPGPWTGPSTGLDERDLLRLCWVSACLEEVFRTGMVMDGSPLASLPAAGPVDLLALAADGTVDELMDLTALARERLLPRLQALATAGPTWLGPTFRGSSLMRADADLVTGHTLIELETGLGRKTPTGRKAALDGTTLFQLLGYVLHDHDDAHQIQAVALYQARYGHFAVWRLDRLLHELADQAVDLPALRQQWATMLDAGKPA